jgi:YidC/Oxa1 family membrane protein insertase
LLANVLDPLYQLMAAIMAAIYSVVPNYAVAIFGLTCIVLAILTPLTLKGLRSTIKIQKLMPEQKRLQAQFKDDRQALNEAIMAMYKENKVSPVGGCLPFIVQSPFFIALFGVLQGMSRVKYWKPTGQPFLEMQATGKVDGKIPEGAIPVGLPNHLPTGSSLYSSLFGAVDPPAGSGLPALRHAPGEVKAFGFDLARSANEMVSKGFVAFLPYLVLIVLMIGLQVFAQRQVNRRNPAAAAANPQMQTITKVMPFLFGIWGWAFQAGLTLYWTTSSALRIVQQWALYRFDPTLAESVKDKQVALAKEAASGKKPVTTTKPKPKPAAGGLLARGKAGADKLAGHKDAAGKGGRKPAPSPKSVPKRGPATKPVVDGPVKGTSNGTSNGSSNGSGGSGRPNPGRQQPKKRRKGR